MLIGKGGKNRRRGKNENEDEKRELVFKEDGQGELIYASVTFTHYFRFLKMDGTWQQGHKLLIVDI